MAIHTKMLPATERKISRDKKIPETKLEKKIKLVLFNFFDEISFYQKSYVFSLFLIPI